VILFEQYGVRLVLTYRSMLRTNLPCLVLTKNHKLVGLINVVGFSIRLLNEFSRDTGSRAARQTSNV